MHHDKTLLALAMATACAVAPCALQAQTNAAPVVSFVRPANGATVTSGALSCAVNASDADGIRQLQWYVDGTLIHTEAYAPYDDCRIGNLSPGTHVIRAVATDNRGATGAAQITVSVGGTPPPPPPANLPPVVSIVQPANGATVSSGALSCVANASDADGIRQLQWYVDGTLIHTEASTPYDDCRIANLSPGSHVIRAVATDNRGATSAAQITVSVGGTPPPPPPANLPPVVSFVQPANGATVTSGALSCAVNASDADGIRQVDWYLDGALVHTDLQAPYDTCNISNLAAGAHTIRAVATDTRGATAAAQVTVNAVGTPPPPPPTAGCGIGSTAAIAVSAVPSRVSGIAPLSVFFDASATSATATSRPYHDLEYRWDFGDAAGGAAWSQGSGVGIGTNSKNSANGPVAAHVFETAGTYNVCVRVTDGANTADRALAITVTAPDSAAEFSGRNTLCVDSRAAPVAGVDGCPIAAAVLHSADFAGAINTTARNGATHKRILFRRGSTFSNTTNATINANGPGLVGAYGSGAKPLVTGTSSKMILGNPSNLTFADWRLMDLSFDGQNQSASGGTAVETIGPFRQVTMLRLEARRMSRGVLLSKWFLDNQVNNVTAFRAPLWSEFALVDSVIEDLYSYAFLGEVNRLAMLGNRFHARTSPSAPLDAGGHLVRIGYTNSASIGHNHFAGSAGNSLTIRGQPHGGDRTLPPGIWTEKVVVSDNVIMGGTSVWFFTIWRVNSTHDTRFRNIIVERNSLVATPPTTTMLVTEAGELTVRNNLFNLTGAAGATAIWMDRGPLAPVGVNVNASVYNNTAYSGSAGNANFRFLEIVNGAPPNLRVRNNLSYAPNLVGSHTVVSGTPGPGAVISHNTDGAAIRSGNPGFGFGGGLAEPEAWRANGPDAVDRGTPVPVWSDFFLLPRTGTYDLGAVNPAPLP